MTANQLAAMLLSLPRNPENVLLIAAKKSGGYVGFEPAEVIERDGMAIITLDPVPLGCDGVGTLDNM